MKFIRKHPIGAVFLALGLLLFAFIISVLIHRASINNSVKQEFAAIKQQEASLQLPETKRRYETNQGCTWDDRQDWDSEGCYIGVADIYDERGPDRKNEQVITAHLLAAGWQSRNSLPVGDSPAAHMFGPDGLFIKNTSEGRFCAGFSYEYHSDDTVSGHRSFDFYILGPSDHGCNR